MISIRAADDDDKAAILELHRTVFGELSAERVERLWAWHWHQDPRLEPKGYRGVVVEWDDRLISSMSSLPAGLYLNGQPVAATWFADMVVHWPTFRQALREERMAARADGTPAKKRSSLLRQGLSSAMMEHSSNDPIQMGKYITNQMYAVALKTGYRCDENAGNWRRRLSYAPRLARGIGKPLATLTARLIDRTLPALPPQTVAVSELKDDFDQRFDHLWRAVCGEYAAIGLRDSTLLNWRFRHHPENHYTVLMIADGEQVRGYLVFTIGRRGRYPYGKILDLLTAVNDREALDALLISALYRLRQSGVDGVACFASHPTLIAALDDLAFTTNEGPKRALFFRGMADCELYVTESDSDGE